MTNSVDERIEELLGLLESSDEITTINNINFNLVVRYLADYEGDFNKFNKYMDRLYKIERNLK